MFGIFITHPEESLQLTKTSVLHNFAVGATGGAETFRPYRVGFLRGFRFLGHRSPPKILELERYEQQTNESI